MPVNGAIPPARYVQAEYVLGEMARFGDRRLNRLDPMRVFVLAVIGGGFITAGALFSILLADGVETRGLVRLLEGIGFSAGFFFVVLSEAVLNMGFFSLLLMETGWGGWDEAIFRNLIPAGIGNLIGGTLLVALPFWYALRPLARTEEA